MSSDHFQIADVVGVILAGGQSTRFGRDKAMAMLAGRPLIKHVAATMVSIFASCLLVTNNPENYSFLDLPTTPDLYPGFGPLAGIHAALKRINVSRAFVVGCDMPMIDPVLIRFICGLGKEDEWDVVLPWLERGPEPLFGLYRKTALPLIEKNLKGKIRKIEDALSRLKVRRVSQAEILAVVPDLSSLHNVNWPTDLAAETED